MRLRNALAATIALTALTACGIPSKAQRVQEAAYELNMGTRFSRMDMALERVAKAERAGFLTRHRKWHNEIRIDDIELAGVAFRDDGDAQLFLQVVWHRMDGQDSHTTVVSQRWHDNKGTWLLAGEERAQGDVGLFGEAPPPAPPNEAGMPEQKAARGDTQFRTTTIRE